MRPLPAGGLVEDSVEPALALEGETGERSRSDLLAGVDDPVGLVEGLRRPRSHVLHALLMLVEAGDVRGLKVDLGSPSTIHSASARPRRFLLDPHSRGPTTSSTSGVSPRIGSVSGVSESRPLMAYLMPTDSSPTILASAPARVHLLDEVVLGERVLGGESAASSTEGISSGS